MSLTRKLLIILFGAIGLIASVLFLSGAFTLWIIAPVNPDDWPAEDILLYRQAGYACIVAIISGIATALLKGITLEDL